MVKKTDVCTRCGGFGKPKKIVRGSLLIELVLWLTFIVPGLIYTIWRTTSQSRACPFCKSLDSMVPLDTPVGQRLLQQAWAEQGRQG